MKRMPIILCSRRWEPTRCGAITSPKNDAAYARARSLRRLGLLDAVPIKRGEVDGVDHQGRKTAVANGVGDDVPGEREQHPRAFDQHDLLRDVLRHVSKPEHTSINQLDIEQNHLFMLRLAFDDELDLIIAAGERLRIDVELN